MTFLATLYITGVYFGDIETLYIEVSISRKKISKMYRGPSVATNVTPVEGIIFEKGNSGLVCIKLN